jgi:K+-sensing histidine kinase KdpD
MSHRRQAGLGTTTLSGSRGLYVPLVSSGTDGGALGVLGIYPTEPRRFEDPEQQRLADAFATQMATSIERARLAERRNARGCRSRPSSFAARSQLGIATTSERRSRSYAARRAHWSTTIRS